MYRWFITYRYLFSRIISFAALVVVAASVALLIIIVSVMEGFSSELQRRVRGTSSDIKVESTRYIGLKDSEKVAGIVARVPGVRATAPYVETPVLYRAERIWLRPGERGDLEDRLLRVIDLERELAVGDLSRYIAAGRLPVPGFPKDWPKDPRKLFSQEWVASEMWKTMFGRPPPLPREKCPPPVLVGTEAFRREWLHPGDLIRITAFSPKTQLPESQVFMVAGYFKTGLYELDSKGILMEMSVADRFLGLRQADGALMASGVRVAIEPLWEEPEALKRVRAAVEAALDGAGILFARTMTWREEKAPLLRAVQVEKTLVSVILGMIVIFSGFMIFIILTVQVVEKTRDIGVLQAMGVSPAGIASIYCSLGLVLCLAGTVLGVAYGVFFSLGVNVIQRWVKLLTGWELFSSQVFYMDKIPVRFAPYDLLFIIAPTVLASLAASLIPAYRAARKDPVVALRYE
jgi:lipoprotein-releasing system permease protein